MGDLLEGKTEAHQTPFESNPWKPQQDYLKKGFAAGSGALDGALTGLGQINDFTANMNPDQLAAIKSMVGTGTGQAQDVAGVLSGQGSNTVGNISKFSDGVGDFLSRAGTDRTGSIINNAGKYADNPYLKGQIDSVIGDVNEGFQRTVGDINSGATATGNINSTRAGSLEAQALDDAMDRAATVSSSMRSGAYQGGLNAALTTDAGQTHGLASGLGMLASSGAQGADLLNRGLDTSLVGNETALNASSRLQTQGQNEIEGTLKKIGAPLDLIQQYMGTVGGNYGSNGYQTQVTQSASPFQQLLGGASSLMGIYKGFG